MNISFEIVTPKDYFKTESLTREAFWDIYKPGCDEHLILHNLRKSPAYIPELEYMAMLNENGHTLMAGHILYTKSELRDKANKPLPHSGGLISFGPVSVLPAYQGKGIGQALINYTVDIAKSLGYRAIGIYGNPLYYHRFGFENAEKYGITTPEGTNFDAFMMLPLYEGALNHLHGSFHEDDAFSVNPKDLEAFEALFPYKEKRFIQKK